MRGECYTSHHWNGSNQWAALRRVPPVDHGPIPRPHRCFTRVPRALKAGPGAAPGFVVLLNLMWLGGASATRWAAPSKAEPRVAE